MKAKIETLRYYFGFESEAIQKKLSAKPNRTGTYPQYTVSKPGWLTLGMTHLLNSLPYIDDQQQLNQAYLTVLNRTVKASKDYQGTHNIFNFIIATGQVDLLEDAFVCLNDESQKKEVLCGTNYWNLRVACANNHVGMLQFYVQQLRAYYKELYPTLSDEDLDRNFYRNDPNSPFIIALTDNGEHTLLYNAFVQTPGDAQEFLLSYYTKSMLVEALEYHNCALLTYPANRGDTYSVQVLLLHCKKHGIAIPEISVVNSNKNEVDLRAEAGRAGASIQPVSFGTNNHFFQQEVTVSTHLDDTSSAYTYF